MENNPRKKINTNRNLDFEQEVIIRLLYDNSLMNDVYGSLISTDFTDEGFRKSYEIMRSFYESSKKWDLIILKHELDAKGLDYDKILLESPRSVSHSEFITIVSSLKDLTLKRKLFDHSQSILNDSRKGGEILMDSIAKLGELNRDEERPTDLSSVIQRHKKTMELRYSGKITGVSTGFEDLDIMLGSGFQKNDLILIGARPSIGKTSLALTFAYNAAKQNIKTLFISIEMRDQDILDRLLSFESGLSCTSIIRGTADKKKTEAAYEALKKMPLSIVELYKATSSDVFATASKEKFTKDTQLVVVDYLQYLGDEVNGGSESVRVGRISRNLKNMANILQIPVIAPTQLNRSSESRGKGLKGVPQLHDLRESGNLEQDADVVMLLHRDIMGTKPEDTRLQIAKNRKGETGKLTLKFNLLTTRFEQ